MKDPVYCGVPSGKIIDLNNPRPEDITIEDIAYSLARILRFNGHLKHQISVARHSCLVADLVPEYLALPALLHDAHEAYLGDIVRPVKRFFIAQKCGNVDELENWWQHMIWEKYDCLLDGTRPLEVIQEADDLQLAREIASFAPAGPFQDGGRKQLDSMGFGPFAKPLEPFPHDPEADEKMFLHFFNSVYPIDRWKSAR